MNLRQATLADYQDVIELLNSLVSENRYSDHDKDSFTELVNSPIHGIFVVESDGKVMGVASSSIRRVVRYKQPIIELDELYVDPRFRKHGAGKALVMAVEDFGRQHDCYRMFIASGYQHADAHEFYKHIGYEDYGRHFKKDL